MHVAILRHADYVGTADQLGNDHGLTVAGYGQCRSIAEQLRRFPTDHVEIFHTDRPRTRQSAQTIAERLPSKPQPVVNDEVCFWDSRFQTMDQLHALLKPKTALVILVTHEAYVQIIADTYCADLNIGILGNPVYTMCGYIVDRDAKTIEFISP